MAVLKEVDPEGASQRRQRRLRRRVYQSKVSMRILWFSIMFQIKPCLQGPNFIWHCDGYDKLAPFGIRIHGCIDGCVNWVALHFHLMYM